MKLSFPEMESLFGVLSGLAFLIPFSFFGLFTGKLADVDSLKRKDLLGVLSIVWSMTTVVSGSTDSFLVFASMRVLLGVFESANNPLAYSLIRDLFPPDFRSTAQSIMMSSIYFGGALSSLSIILIHKIGWRGDYQVTGSIGVLSGLLCLFFLNEPIRGQFDTPQQKQI